MIYCHALAGPNVSKLPYAKAAATYPVRLFRSIMTTEQSITSSRSINRMFLRNHKEHPGMLLVLLLR